MKKLNVTSVNTYINKGQGLGIFEKLVWDHPFKMSAFFRGRGVKHLPNLPTDSSKKLPTVGG